jgi:hypothetical protein
VTALLAGFRGADETLALDRRVSDPALAEAAAIINALGEINR